MRFRHDKYPIPCARVHDAIGADDFPLRASAACIAHQNEQRPAAEFSLFDLVRDPSAVSCAIRIARIIPLGSLPPEPVGAFQAIGGASIGGHGSASEGVAHGPNERLGFGFPAGQFAEQFQAGGDAGDQNVDRGQPMAWVNALVGWARCGERRHLTVTAGAVLALGLAATLTMGV